MKFSPAKGSVLAIVACSFGQAAAADITADQAWASLRDLLVGSGYAVTGEAQKSGNTLTVTGAEFTIAPSTSPTTSTIDMGTLRFIETGDGTVRVEFPDTIPFNTISIDPNLNEPVRIDFNIVQSNADYIISGDPGDVVQTYSADAVSFVMADMQSPAPNFSEDAVKISMTIADVASVSRIMEGSPMPFEGTATTGPLTYEITFDVPGEGSGAMSGQLNGITMAAQGSLPSAGTSGDVLAMVQAGYTVSGNASHTGGNMTVSGASQDGTFSMQTSSSAGAVDFLLNADALTYDVGLRDTSVLASLPDLPIPVAFDADGITMGLSIPMTPGDTPQDFSLLVNMQNFAMSDILWSMFDPGSVLPRDPATLLIDLAGKATGLTNFFDPQVMAVAETTGELPVQIDALDVKALELSLVGASLTGTGDFTFDNTGQTAFGGMPKPTGELNLSLSGGNALIDKLSQMGLIGPQEAGGARMMMGLLAVPGPAPDTLNSKIEINDQGHIMANGQRIQ